LPHLWPTGSSWDISLDCGPVLLLMPFGFHLTVDTLPSGGLFDLRPARHYPRFWIWRPSSERQRDFNPPDLSAAQRTLWADPTPRRPSASLLVLSVPPTWFQHPGAARVSQVPGISLHACHALRRPRQTLQDLTIAVPLCWLLGPLNHRRLLLGLASPRSLTGLYQAWGSAVSLAACVVPCVRFNCFVRLPSSSTAATLGMGGWLNLTRQGLSPCKKRQACLAHNGLRVSRRTLSPEGYEMQRSVYIARRWRGRLQRV